MTTGGRGECYTWEVAATQAGGRRVHSFPDPSIDLAVAAIDIRILDVVLKPKQSGHVGGIVCEVPAVYIKSYYVYDH